MFSLDVEHYARAVHDAVDHPCVDRGASSHDALAACRIDRFLPELIRMARAIGPDRYDTFRLAYRLRICRMCERQGQCSMFERQGCCLDRYLPIMYDAICDIDHDEAKLARLCFVDHAVPSTREVRPYA